MFASSSPPVLFCLSRTMPALSRSVQSSRGLLFPTRKTLPFFPPLPSPATASFSSSSFSSLQSPGKTSLGLSPFAPPPSFVGPQFYNLPYFSVRTFIDRKRTRTRTRVKDEEEEEQQQQTQYNQTYVVPQQQQQQAPQSWRDYISTPSSESSQSTYSTAYSTSERQSASLTPPVVRYLRRVWGYTGAALGIATLTSGFGMMLPFVHPIVWGLGSMIPLFVFYSAKSQTTRLVSYLSFVGLTGLSLSVLLKMSMAMNPMLPMAAMGITAGITFLMTGLSFIAPRGSFLKMGGVLFAGAIGLLASAILGLFFPIFHSIWLYGGVLLFTAFLGYENQKTIADFENGIQDPLHHSLGFFIDIVGLFRHILIILMGRE